MLAVRRGALLILLCAVGVAAACGPGEDTHETSPPQPVNEPTVALVNGPWRWIALAGPRGEERVESPGRYVLRFNEDRTLALKADCNRAAGTYTTEENTLSVKLGPSTLAVCPDKSRSEEFLALVSQAQSFSFQRGRLSVVLSDGSRMFFRAPRRNTGGPETSERRNKERGSGVGLLFRGRWEWTSFQGMDDSTLEVSSPSRYTLEFQGDRVSVVADCNRGSGGFDLKGRSLQFGPIATTRMACPSESLSERYLAYLDSVRGFVVENGDLFLSLMADGGIMHFRPADQADKREE